MEYSRIANALIALFRNVDKSSLNENEKTRLKLLIENVTNYLKKESNDIENSRLEFIYKRRYINFISQMDDNIVMINDVIKGVGDINDTSNRIYKEIRYDKEKGHFKRKRLI